MNILLTKILKMVLYAPLLLIMLMAIFYLRLYETKPFYTPKHI